jgi:MFS family permease
VKHPLTYRNFRFYWLARLTAMLGHNALVMALGWAVYDVARAHYGLRAAAFRLGLVGLAQFLPFLICNPLAGLVADSKDRRIVVRAALLGQLLCLTPLMVMGFQGALSLPVLYIVAAGFAAARAFYMPAMNALISSTLPPESLPRGIAMGAIAGRTGGILGPVLGGYAYAISPGAAFGFAVLLLTLSLCSQCMISATAGQTSGKGGRPLDMMREGLAYVRGNKLLLGTITLDMFATLLGGVTALLPVYARDILHVGPDGLGLLRSASSIGALGIAVSHSWWPIRENVGVKMLAAVAFYGVFTVIFGYSTSLLLSMACLAVLGAADMISVLIRQTLMQISTPDAMRGRVGAISTLFVSASNELGEMESGIAASLMGPVGAVVFGGVASVVLAAVWGRLFPQLLAAQRFENQPIA